MQRIWTAVIPVKGTEQAKSRLFADSSLARAIHLDTILATLTSNPVRRVVVVTTAQWADDSLSGLDLTVVVDPARGLDAAIHAGIEAAGTGPVAVLLGDLPALDPLELEAVLAAAESMGRAFVPDREGSGTVLITSTTDHAPAFGEGSAQRHRDAGYVEIDVPADSGLRRDVDTPEQLESLRGRLGKSTTVATGD